MLKIPLKHLQHIIPSDLQLCLLAYSAQQIGHIVGDVVLKYSCKDVHVKRNVILVLFLAESRCVSVPCFHLFQE